MKPRAARSPVFPVSVQIGVLAAAALSLWGACSYYSFENSLESQTQNRDPYMIAAQVTRLAGLEQAVPSNAVLGYLTDAETGSTVATAMLASAQYELAPRLLEVGTAQEWVLGNFTKPLDFASIGAEHGLRLERDFGNGVVLYRRLGR